MNESVIWVIIVNQGQKRQNLSIVQVAKSSLGAPLSSEHGTRHQVSAEISTTCSGRHPLSTIHLQHLRKRVDLIFSSSKLISLVSLQALQINVYISYIIGERSIWRI